MFGLEFLEATLFRLMCSIQGIFFFFLLELGDLFPLEPCLYKSKGKNREKGNCKKMWNSVQILLAYKNILYSIILPPYTSEIFT